MRRTHIAASLVLCAGVSAAAVAIAGCGNPLHKASNGAAAVTRHSYKGTASVGDFITLDLDSEAHTFAYTNISNGLTGSGTYTVNTDGSYSISESSGCFTDAYEVPGFALVLRGVKTGPTQDTVALVSAIDSQRNTVAGVADKTYNYMQFRTDNGGVEVGHVSMGDHAEVTHAGYYPQGSRNSPPDAFQTAQTFPGTPVEDAPTGALKLTIVDNGVPTDNYVFATTSGQLAVDTGNGSLVCLAEVATSALQPASAGTYRALSFGKNGASTGPGNSESPAQGAVDKVIITVGSDGALLIRDAVSNTTLASGTLQSFAGTALETGIGNPCKGLFSFTVGTQEVFATFTGDEMLFSSFTYNGSGGGPQNYDYFYGVGLKQIGSDG